MPTTIACSFGDVALVPFPFTDQTTSKKKLGALQPGDANSLRNALSALFG